jgi:predicted Zn-dependent peptidase
MVVKEQKVLDFSTSTRDVLHKDPSTLSLTARLQPTTSFDEVIGGAQAAIDQLARGEVPAAKIEAARDHLVAQLVLATQTPGQLGTYLALLTSTTHGDVHGLERWAAALAAVKPEDVARVAKLLTPARRSVVTLSEEKK